MDKTGARWWVGLAAVKHDTPEGLADFMASVPSRPKMRV